MQVNMQGTGFGVVLVLVLTAGAAAQAPDGTAAPGTAGFEPRTVHKVLLRLSEREFAAVTPISSRGGFFGLGSPPKPPAPEPGQPERELHRNTFGMVLPWGRATVTVDGQTFADVGLRYKGNGTIADASRSIKKSWKIDLEHFGGKERWLGRKTLNLHSGVADPSKLRETLGYQLYRAAGVPAPLTSFAEVWLDVPGKYEEQFLGLYTLVEQPDRLFLQRNFGNDKGLLLKPEGVREFTDRGDEWKSYAEQFGAKREVTDEEAARLIAFMRLVLQEDDDEFRRRIGEFVDVEGYLRYLLVTSFIANSDSFFALGHNFYMYLHPETRRLHFFAWDVDRAFANLPFFGSKNQQMNFSLPHPYPGKHRLTDRLLAIPENSARFQALVQELATTVFVRETLLQSIAKQAEFIQELVERDAAAAAARKDGPMGFGVFQILPQPPDLVTFVERRTRSVAAQLAGQSTGHIPAEGFGSGGFRLGDLLAGPLLETFDADHDERLSRAEWMVVPERVFAACQPNDKHQVTELILAAGLSRMFPLGADENRERRSAFSPGTMMAGPLFKRADVDKDKDLTRAELVELAGKLFDQFARPETAALDEDDMTKLLNEVFPPTSGGARRPAAPAADNRPE